MGRKEEFIKRVKEKHRDKYDFSNIIYINRYTEIEVVCNECGKYFKARPDDFIYGNVKCPHEIEIERIKIEYLMKILKITNRGKFENYEYKHILLNSDSYDLGIVLFKCKEHPNYYDRYNEISVLDHILGKGCFWCDKKQPRLDFLWRNHFSKFCDFIDKSNEVHNFKYDYSKVNFNKKIDFKKKIKIICPKHGVFEQSAYNHMHGSGCPKCSNRISKPEQELNKLLINKFGKSNVINQYKEMRYPYHVDFYIKSLDLFIELNAHWTHNDHFFDANNKRDCETLEKWTEKSKEHSIYKAAVETWTKRDLLKLEIATENKLNYKVFWDNDLTDAREWLESLD